MDSSALLHADLGVAAVPWHPGDPSLDRNDGNIGTKVPGFKQGCVAKITGHNLGISYI